MKYTLIFLISAQAYCYEINNVFLNKLAHIESDNNPTAVGDSCKALGIYQFHKEAWDDACKRNGVNWEFNRTNAFDVNRSNIVARWHLAFLADRIEAHGFEVTPMRLYMCWNLGVTGALKLNLQPNNKPALNRANQILNNNDDNKRQKNEFSKSSSTYDGMFNRGVNRNVTTV